MSVHSKIRTAVALRSVSLGVKRPRPMLLKGRIRDDGDSDGFSAWLSTTLSWSCSRFIVNIANRT